MPNPEHSAWSDDQGLTGTSPDRVSKAPSDAVAEAVLLYTLFTRGGDSLQRPRKAGLVEFFKQLAQAEPADVEQCATGDVVTQDVPHLIRPNLADQCPCRATAVT